jgi:hypothetical protein
LYEDACVVRELRHVDISAISFDVGTIVNVVTFVHVSNTFHPNPRLLGILAIGIVTSIPSQPSADVEKATIGNA